jgi:hypothetical protein
MDLCGFERDEEQNTQSYLFGQGPLSKNMSETPEAGEQRPWSLLSEYFSHAAIPAAVSSLPLHAFEVVSPEGARARVALHRYRLKLRFPFGTSHSSTTHRDNALFLLSVEGSLGRSGVAGAVDGSSTITLAEAGLPPKRQYVYCSDVDDCVTFAVAWETRLRELLQNAVGAKDATCCTNTDDSCLHPLSCLSADSARPLRAALAASSDSPRIGLLRTMLVALDTCKPVKEGLAFTSASQAMIEVAVMSALASYGRGTIQATSQPDMGGIGRVHSLLGLDPRMAETLPTFYTVALNDNLAVMLESAQFGRSFTPHVKIKLDADVAKAGRVLLALSKWCSERDQEEEKRGLQRGKSWWSVDANCAWSPSVAMAMLETVLLPHKGRIFMVEQPFPVELTAVRRGCARDEDVEAWKRVRQAYASHGLRIFADESMRTAADVPDLLGLVDGVNIKMEKCGGYRGGLRAAYAAREAGLALWVGCMVGSNLNSFGAAQLVAMPGVVGCDLDGAALVTKDSEIVQGGFSFVAGHIALV